MSEMLDKLEINAESALDFDDTTLVVPMTLVREMFERLEEENAKLKRELRTERRTTLGALLDSGAISLVQWEEGMEQLALLTAEESE